MVREFAMAFQDRKVSGLFEKPGPLSRKPRNLSGSKSHFTRIGHVFKDREVYMPETS